MLNYEEIFTGIFIDRGMPLIISQAFWHRSYIAENVNTDIDIGQRYVI